MYGIPDYLLAGISLVGFLWGTAARCYFSGGSSDLVIWLAAPGSSGALAIASQRTGR
jgi:hypothetical protein